MKRASVVLCSLSILFLSSLPLFAGEKAPDSSEVQAKTEIEAEKAIIPNELPPPATPAEPKIQEPAPHVEVETAPAATPMEDTLAQMKSQPTEAPNPNEEESEVESEAAEKAIVAFIQDVKVAEAEAEKNKSSESCPAVIQQPNLQIRENSSMDSVMAAVVTNALVGEKPQAEQANACPQLVGKTPARVIAAFSTWATNAFLFYPIEYIKMHLQAGEKLGTILSRNFKPYQGFAPYAFASCSMTLTNLGLYDAMKAEGCPPGFAGSVSGLAASTLSNPAWMYHQQCVMGRKTGCATQTVSCFAKELAKNPRMGLRGSGMNIAYTIPSAVYWEVFEGLRAELKKNAGPDGNFHGLDCNAMAGVGARAVSGIFTTPFDNMAFWKRADNRSYPEILAEKVSEGGDRALYRGGFTGVAKSCLAAGMSMYIFGKTMSYLGHEVQSNKKQN